MQKRAFYDNLLTIYGRKSVLEDLSPPLHKLHLADSNRRDQFIARIEQLATERQIEIAHWSRKALSRISKNARQYQGVALDLTLLHYGPVENLLREEEKNTNCSTWMVSPTRRSKDWQKYSTVS